MINHHIVDTVKTVTQARELEAAHTAVPLLLVDMHLPAEAGAQTVHIQYVLGP